MAGPFLTPGAWLEDHYTLLHKNIKALGLVVSEKKIFFYVFPMTPSGQGPYGPQGHGTIIHCYTQNMKALELVVSEKKILFYVFPIVSLWELSVAMETRVLIRPGPKPNTTFSHPQ